MAVYISKVAQRPDWAALPAAKIIDYPNEERDYRPFAQLQMALSPQALHVRMLAFEAKPEAESRLLWIWSGALVLEFLPGRSAAFFLKSRQPCAAETSFCGGEDLQGIFWGAQCALPRRELEKELGLCLVPGAFLRGNAFKTCPAAATHPHFGCLFPSRPVYTAEEACSLSPADMGVFALVDY